MTEARLGSHGQAHCVLAACIALFAALRAQPCRAEVDPTAAPSPSTLRLRFLLCGVPREQELADALRIEMLDAQWRVEVAGGDPESLAHTMLSAGTADAVMWGERPGTGLVLQVLMANRGPRPTTLAPGASVSRASELRTLALKAHTLVAALPPTAGADNPVPVPSDERGPAVNDAPTPNGTPTHGDDATTTDDAGAPLGWQVELGGAVALSPVPGEAQAGASLGGGATLAVATGLRVAILARLRWLNTTRAETAAGRVSLGEVSPGLFLQLARDQQGFRWTLAVGLRARRFDSDGETAAGARGETIEWRPAAAIAAGLSVPLVRKLRLGLRVGVDITPGRLRFAVNDETLVRTRPVRPTAWLGIIL